MTCTATGPTGHATIVLRQQTADGSSLAGTMTYTAEHGCISTYDLSYVRQ